MGMGRLAQMAARVGDVGGRDILESGAFKRAAQSSGRMSVSRHNELVESLTMRRGYKRMGIAAGGGAGVLAMGRKGASSGAQGSPPSSSSGGMSY